ncbi:unnamed protein product [Phytophthora lilii]|uniref:Unnamed protein product n=1 Tax=Phytophthora lilii TaxID=2077276 RepID=A0A9W6X504_9STRA|nr:unnamed protein product [Phytophthora lilii]
MSTKLVSRRHNSSEDLTQRKTSTSRWMVSSTMKSISTAQQHAEHLKRAPTSKTGDYSRKNRQQVSTDCGEEDSFMCLDLEHHQRT